jgi:hypothetical protein
VWDSINTHTSSPSSFPDRLFAHLPLPTHCHPIMHLMYILDNASLQNIYICWGSPRPRVKLFRQVHKTDRLVCRCLAMAPGELVSLFCTVDSELYGPERREFSSERSELSYPTRMIYPFPQNPSMTRQQIHTFVQKDAAVPLRRNGPSSNALLVYSSWYYRSNCMFCTHGLQTHTSRYCIVSVCPYPCSSSQFYSLTLSRSWTQ